MKLIRPTNSERSHAFANSDWLVPPGERGRGSVS